MKYAIMTVRGYEEHSQEKPFIVFWENDCGYGTDYYATEAEQEAALVDIRKTGTNAWPGHIGD